MTNPYGGNTWAYVAWQDAHLDLDPNEQMFDSTEALAAAQTWEEVLSLPTDPTQRLPRMMPTGRHLPRTACPVSERPQRGAIGQQLPGPDGERSFVLLRTLAYDGRPAVAGKRGASSAVKSEAARRRNVARYERIRAEAAAPAPAPVAPRYVMIDGEAVDILNPDGSIG